MLSQLTSNRRDLTEEGAVLLKKSGDLGVLCGQRILEAEVVLFQRVDASSVQLSRQSDVTVVSEGEVEANLRRDLCLRTAFARRTAEGMAR